MNPQQKTSFNKKGYYTILIDLAKQKRVQLLSYCKSSEYNCVFRHVGGPQDTERSQVTVKRCAVTEQIISSVECALNQACADWEIKDVVALKNDPDRPVQDIHRDMSLTDVATHTAPPGLFLLTPPSRLCRVHVCVSSMVASVTPLK